MSSNQKKIRDIQRQMKKFGTDNPELLKKLEDLKTVKEDVQMKEKLRKNSVKYHMVKFIERKKVTRAIRSLNSKIEKGGDDVSNLQAKKAQLEEDLAYIMYYPMEQKYVALFPGSEKSENSGKQFNSASRLEQAAEMLEKSKKLSKIGRELAIQAWKLDIQQGRVDKVAHAMEVEYNGGSDKRKKGDEEEQEYHKYTNNMQPSSALTQYQARHNKSFDIERDEHDSEAAPVARTITKKDAQLKRKLQEVEVEKEESTTAGRDREQKDKKVKTNSSENKAEPPSDNKAKKENNKKDKKEKAAQSSEVVAAVIKPEKEEQTDSFFLEEVDEEEEARQEVIAEKIKKNVGDIKKFVNRNKHDAHKRLFSSKNANNNYSHNKNHKKF